MPSDVQLLQVPQAGFEPATIGLEGLSTRRWLLVGAGGHPTSPALSRVVVGGHWVLWVDLLRTIRGPP